MADITEYYQFINRFLKINKKSQKRETTFLKVIGKEKNELTFSKLLRFFFDPNENHGLEDTFLQAFIKCINDKINNSTTTPYTIVEKRLLELTNSKRITVKIEELTEKASDPINQKKRIDIIIKSPDWVIGIENKIYAELYNPIEIYSEHISAIKGERTSYLIVLSLDNCIKELQNLISDKDNANVIYYNITYKEFFEALTLSKISLTSSTTTWYALANHFIQAIEEIVQMPTNYNHLHDLIKDNFFYLNELNQALSELFYELKQVMSQKVNDEKNNLKIILTHYPKENKIDDSLLLDEIDEIDEITSLSEFSPISKNKMQLYYCKNGYLISVGIVVNYEGYYNRFQFNFFYCFNDNKFYLIVTIPSSNDTMEKGEDDKNNLIDNFNQLKKEDFSFFGKCGEIKEKWGSVFSNNGFWNIIIDITDIAIDSEKESLNIDNIYRVYENIFNTTCEYYQKKYNIALNS